MRYNDEQERNQRDDVKRRGENEIYKAAQKSNCLTIDDDDGKCVHKD
jgi:hypothetical protein